MERPSRDMTTDQRFALVTGAASGLGRALAVELGKSGWHIGIADVNAAAGGETIQLVEQAGGSAEFLPLDVSDERQWKAVHQDLRQRWPRLDLLVNNAGVCASGEFGQAPLADWDWLMGVNLRGVVLGSHTMLDWLKANRERSWMLNVSSMAGLLATPYMSAYGVSKAAVIALSESLYVELRPHNVGVSVVCPWFIPTNLLQSGRFQEASHREFAERKMAAARNSPESFARLSLKGLFRNKFLITLGLKSSLASTVKSTFRQPFLNLVCRLMERRASAGP